MYVCMPSVALQLTELSLKKDTTGYYCRVAPFHFPNPGRGSGVETPADEGPGYYPQKTFGILYVIWCILMRSGGSYM